MITIEKQEKELDYIYNAFLQYAASPENRDIEILAGKLSKPPERVRAWAKRWNWLERVKLYDKEAGMRSEQKSRFNEAALQLNVFDMEPALQKFLSEIRDKLIHSTTDIREMSLGEILKLTSLLLKAIPDIQNALESLEGQINSSHDDDFPAPISEIIKTDEKAFRLASSLLERISEIRSEEKV